MIVSILVFTGTIYCTPNFLSTCRRYENDHMCLLVRLVADTFKLFCNVQEKCASNSGLFKITMRKTSPSSCYLKRTNSKKFNNSISETPWLQKCNQYINEEIIRVNQE